MEIVLQWYELVILITFAILCGFGITAILSGGCREDAEIEISYWRNLYFQAREHLPMDARLELEDEK